MFFKYSILSALWKILSAKTDDPRIDLSLFFSYLIKYFLWFYILTAGRLLYMVGPLLEVEMSKKCTLLWREAHVQIIMVKAPHVRTTSGCLDVVLCGRRKGSCTSSKVTTTGRFCSNFNPTTTTWDYTTLHYIPPHYTRLHRTPLDYTTLHAITLHCPTHKQQLQRHYTNYIAWDDTTLYSTTRHSISVRSNTLRYTTSYNNKHKHKYKRNTLHYTILRVFTLHCTPLHYITLH